ncbi:hypothetical protein MACJ_001638 [Theileria orientalis]|uniref:Uncharacterized protein n=1 Tax=Theileria orientalis TaxID=68886 RepID=A0A976M8Q6_THEOR|nr:hypothetical protein MACJ_001638 [Theileria orientalis]
MSEYCSPQKQLFDLTPSGPKGEQESKAPSNNEKKTDDDPFNIRLRLDRSETHSLGVVCLPENIQGMKIDMFKPSDPSATFDDESIVWKSYANDKLLTRQFKSRKTQVDTDCYFMMVEHKANNTILVSPVSNYFIFDPHIPLKTQNLSNKTDSIEERLKRIVRTEDEDTKTTTVPNVMKMRKTTESTKANYGWDYKNEELSDDENMPTVARTEDSQEDPFYNKDLTNYGHHVKTLLMKQEEEEVDEELKQFSDDDDESQVSGSSKVKGDSQQSAPELSFSDRVIEYIKENKKVTIKSILVHFNIKEKNEDFRTLQSVIQKMCTMSTEQRDGKTTKYISLK